MTELEQRFNQVYEKISQAERACHREGEVQLLAVSKKKPASMIKDAYDLGQRHFGESYLQESLAKMGELRELRDICWHFIGPIQSNKTRDIASSFAWVHSVDRLKIAKRLSDQRPEILPPLNICLQANVSDEASKSGVTLEQLADLVHEVSLLPRLSLRGLMVIPAPEADPVKQRRPFSILAEQLSLINIKENLDMDTLSMGMTGDLEAAIAEGATIVRVGTALFGARPINNS